MKEEHNKKVEEKLIQTVTSKLGPEQDKDKPK